MWILARIHVCVHVSDCQNLGGVDRIEGQKGARGGGNHNKWKGTEWMLETEKKKGVCLLWSIEYWQTSSVHITTIYTNNCNGPNMETSVIARNVLHSVDKQMLLDSSFWSARKRTPPSHECICMRWKMQSVHLAVLQQADCSVGHVHSRISHAVFYRRRTLTCKNICPSARFHKTSSETRRLQCNYDRPADLRPTVGLQFIRVLLY